MLRVGIIGAGDISSYHAEAYLKLPDVEICAFADPVTSKAEKLCARFGGKVFSSLDEVLDEGDADIIDICSPDFLHTVQAEKALKAGKHVLCEKPIGLRLGEAERVVKLAEESGSVFMVGQVLRFFPEYEWIRSFISRGILGASKSVYAARLNPYPFWRGWFSDPRLSSGAAADLLVHDADFCHWVFGPVDRVAALGLKDENGIWNHVQVLAAFESGVTAAFEASYSMPGGFPKTFFLRILCEKGCIEYDKRSERPVAVFEPNRDPWYPEIEKENPFLREIRYFVECIRQNRKPDIIKPEEALYSLKIVLAVIRSVEENGRVIELPN